MQFEVVKLLLAHRPVKMKIGKNNRVEVEKKFKEKDLKTLTHGIFEKTARFCANRIAQGSTIA